MSWPPIGWSLARGKIQIAMVAGHVFRVVVGEERRVVGTNGRKRRVCRSRVVLLYLVCESQ